MEINQNKPIIGLYEKALPANLSWFERLALAKKLGFDYVEMSIDETAERQSRLQWDNAQKMAFIQAKLETKMDVPSLCLSVHRAYPLGSNDPKIRQKSRILMQEAINLAKSLGIRNIQLAGYDVYYEPSDVKT